MLYLANVADLPIGCEYRVLADTCEYWNGLSLIETKQPIDGLQIAPDTFPNGVTTNPYASVEYPCLATWEIKKAQALPDLEQSVDNMNTNAFARPVETMNMLLSKAGIDNAVNLYNSDGIKRVEKVVG